MQTLTDSQVIGYDYDSIMHYGKTYFSKALYNLVTIQAKNDPSKPLGGDELTDSDKEKLRKLYDCTSEYGFIAYFESVYKIYPTIYS